MSNNLRFFVLFKCKYFALLLAICHSKGRTHEKTTRVNSHCFIWTDDEVELPLKVCIDKREYRLGVLPRTLSLTRTAKTFWLAAMLFCSHAVEMIVETGPDNATSSDSKVSGFDCPHVSEKISDSKVSTLESGLKRFRIRRSDWTKGVSGKKSIRIQKYPDTCP